MSFQNKILTLVVIACYSYTNYAAVGCMSRYDGLTLKPKPVFVKCNCPCERYRKLDQRGRCENCLHMHEPEYIENIR